MKQEAIYEGKILSLYKLDGRWEFVDHANAVCVLVTDGDRVLGVEQWRPAIKATSWELPAGLIDEGESPQQAALRELAEEVKLTGELELVTQSYSSPGFCNEMVSIFELSNPRPAQGELDEGEELKPVWRDLKQTWQDIQAGKLMSSAHTVIALSYALARQGKLP